MPRGPLAHGRTRGQPVRGVAIYMEGGGPGRSGRAALRQGMDHFLGPLKLAARRRSLSWKLVPCGSRSEAYRRFRNACENADPDETRILLVDAEAPVTLAPRAHLRERVGDRWDLGFASDDTVHLMVQLMETWLVADPVALADYYGRGFNAARLPERLDLEEEPKASVERALEEATRRTGKGAYHKIRHASELLKRLDQERVKARCRHCNRLFEALDGIFVA